MALLGTGLGGTPPSPTLCVRGSEGKRRAADHVAGVYVASVRMAGRTPRPRIDIRFLLLLLTAATTLAAACPARDTLDSVPATAEWARVVLGETAALHDGRVRVTFVAMARAGSFADVTLTVAAGGTSVTDEVTVVRQSEYSSPIRLPGWVARIEGFPGVDSVRVVAWPE